ncbi:hypothetical protein ACFPOD_09090 [Nitratireductor kimnyeongensis]|uniref:Flagellar protein FlgN n=1 Tax=Nitratireductor kimnyeongensis TaxID=430679 RepID=A0ABW0T7B2_9HYPH|nr:hypothetical protein [Nitratireductor kimnyeongensis]QZZ36255.1 hypothetical protein KW403_03670 [Nitratireductor kimnyeongensis]
MYDMTSASNSKNATHKLNQHGGASALAIMRRIEETIDAETAAIREDPAFDLKASNARKSRHLYELTRALKGANEAGLANAHRDALIRLRDKLADNEATIRAHMGAVNEVADLLQDAIQRAQTDGTYSQQEFGQAASA